MNIVFKHISIHNFLSFENIELDLNIPGYTLVQGINNNTVDLATSNGSGKSSIWEAISWSITGETIRGSKNVKRINCSDKDKCWVHILFDIDNKQYEIYRQTSPTKLQFIVSGEDVSGKGVRDTEQIIKEYLPDLTSSLLGSVVILGQGLPQRFSNNTPVGRKDVLEKLSRSDFMIQDVKNRISERKHKLDIDLREIEDNILKKETEKTIIEERLNKITDKLANLSSLEDIDKEIRRYTALRSEIESSLSDYNSKHDSLNNSLNEHVIKQKQLQSDMMHEVDNKSLSYDILLSNKKMEEVDVCHDIKNVKQEIDKLKSIKDICPTCGQRIPNVIKPDTSSLESKLQEYEYRLSSIQCEISDMNKEKQEVLSQIKQKYLKQESSIKELIDSYRTELTNVDTHLVYINQQYKDVENALYKINLDKNNRDMYENSLKEELVMLNQTFNTIDSDILYYNNEKEILQLHIDIIQKMSTVVTRDFRGYLLSSVIDFIEKKAKEYSQEVFETDKIGFCLDGNNILITYDNKDYTNLSGGERQKVDLIIQFAIRDMLCKYLNFSSNILAVDELFDGLDIIGCEKVLNLISNKLSDVESIYIITHHSSIPIPFDNILTVTKGEDGVSRISW